MRKYVIIGILLFLVFSFISPTFANEQDTTLRIDEFGIKSGVIIKPEEEQNNSPHIRASSSNLIWETLPAKTDVSLNKDWTISFNDTVTIDKIDGIVIERAGVFIPVRVRLFPTAKQINVTPQESYIANEKYTVRVFLNNGKRYKMEFVTKNTPTVSSKYGNTTGNVSNNGLVAEDNGWIYYSNSSDNYSLYKIKKDGTQQTKLNNNRSSNLNVLGGWVYYRDYSNNGYLSKVRIDGTEDVYVSRESSSSVSVTDDGWIYYRGYLNRMSKIRYDGTNGQTLYNNYFYPVITDGFMYASDVSNERLTKYNISTDESNVLTNERVSHINVIDNWIYYINIDDNRIYKIKTDGTNRMKINDSWTEGLNVSNGWAYYVNSEDRSIYRIKLDGTNEQRVNDTPSTNINVISEWIYYEDPTNNKYYKMNLDGSKWSEVQ